MNQYINPYQSPQGFMQSQNLMAPQQILQANGIESARQIKLAPNSSVLVADATMPIVYKCMSDGVGVVNVEAFDIVPHKSQTEIDQQTMLNAISDLNARMSKLEEITNAKSTTTRNRKSESNAD